MPYTKPSTLSHQEHERSRTQPQPTPPQPELPPDAKMEVGKWYAFGAASGTGVGYYARYYEYPNKSTVVKQYSQTKPDVPYQIQTFESPKGTPMTSADMMKELTKEPGAYGVGTPENVAYVERMSPTWKEMNFWYSQGYPQYFGKYQSFEVPTGAKISGITEMPGGYLEVAFQNLVAPAQYQYKPRSEGQLKALLGTDELPDTRQHIAEVWEPEAAPTYSYVPSYLRSSHKLKQILELDEFPTEATETNVQSAMTKTELEAQAKLIGIQDKLSSGEQLDIYDYTFISKMYPDIAQNLAAQMTTQEQLEAINTKLLEGQSLNIFEAITVAKHEPAVAKQMADLTAFNMKVGDINLKLTAGQDLDITEYMFLSKHFPDVTKQWQAQQKLETQIESINTKLAGGQELDLFESMTVAKYAPDVAKTLATPKGVVGGYTIPSPSATPSPEYYESNLQASRQFYAGLGYPELGGKYAPFNIPEGMKVAGITQTAEGLQISFEAIPKTFGPLSRIWEGRTPTPLELKKSEYKEFASDVANLKANIAPGAYGTLTGWFLTRRKEASAMEQFMPFGPKTSAGLTATAGFIAAAEGQVNPYTPFEWSAPFIGGYIFGAGIIGYGVGKAIQPITGTFKELIQSRASNFLTAKYQAALQEGRLEWKGTLENLVSKLTGATPKPLATGIVGYPTLVSGSAFEPSYAELAGSRGFKMGSDITLETYKQLPSLIASEDIFSFTLAPKTAGYGLSTSAFVQQIPKAASAFSLPGSALSSITGKWFLTHPETVPKEELGFSKQPQTFRPAQETALSFSKQFGAMPTQNQLLMQISMQEAKAIPASGSMQNIFGQAGAQVAKTVTVPYMVSPLAAMTSWLLKQEAQAKVTQKSAITPIAIQMQYRPQTQQMEETTEFLTGPVSQQQLISTKQPQIQQQDFIPSLRPLFEMPTATTKATTTVSPIILLPQLQQKGVDIFAISTPKAKVTTPKPSMLELPTKQALPLGMKLSPYPFTISEAKPDIAVGLKLRLGEKQKAEAPLLPETPTNATAFLGAPKAFPFMRDFKKDWPSAGGKGEKGMDYLFGRQKRQYPVMTGGEAFNVMFGSGKQRKKKK